MTTNMGEGDPRDFETYARLVDRNGNAQARAALARGERVVLGLRTENNTFDSANQDDPLTRADESRAGTGIYNDRIVVLWRDREGRGHAETFNRANTEPTAQYDVHAYGNIPKSRRMASPNGRERGDGVDVNGDGKRDLGRWQDGTTALKIRPNKFMGAVALMPTDAAVSAGKGRVNRDTNGDGWFTSADANRVQNLNNTFYIHVGSRGNTDSSGCQTIHRDDYPRFIDSIRANPAQTRWQYVLVTVDSTMFKDVQAGRRGGDPVALDPSGRGLHGAHHPQHALFKSILGKVQEEDRRLGRSSDRRSENLAGALTLAAYTAGLRQADEFHFNADGSRAVVVDQPDRAGMARKVTSVDVGEAVNTPIERSEQALQQATPAVGHTALQPAMSPRPAAQPALSR